MKRQKDTLSTQEGRYLIFILTTISTKSTQEF